MPFPPAVPPNTRVDQTPQFVNHPGDHNMISNALTDIINQISAMGTWIDYSCSWAANGTLQPALGNGTLVSRYTRLGKVCVLRIGLTWGASTTGGKGYWTFTVPFAANSLTEQYIPCKAATSNAVSWVGLTYLPPGQSYCIPSLPASQSLSYVKAVQNADNTGNPGTGVPLLPGSYPFDQVGTNLIVQGAYEIA